MIEIEIIQLGDTYPVDFSKIEKFGKRSTIFKIAKILENSNADILNKETIRLSDTDFNFLLHQQEQVTADFSVVIVNRPLQDNYFS